MYEKQIEREKKLMEAVVSFTKKIPLQMYCCTNRDGINNSKDATFEKNGGNIYSNKGSGIANHGGTVTIRNGGDIRSNGDSGIYNNGTLTIDGWNNIYSNICCSWRRRQYLY